MKKLCQDCKKREATECYSVTLSSGDIKRSEQCLICWMREYIKVNEQEIHRLTKETSMLNEELFGLENEWNKANGFNFY